MARKKRNSLDRCFSAPFFGKDVLYFQYEKVGMILNIYLLKMCICRRFIGKKEKGEINRGKQQFFLAILLVFTILSSCLYIFFVK